MRPHRMNYRAKHIAFMDYQTGQGVLSNGQAFSPIISPRRKYPTLTDKLNTVASLSIDGRPVEVIMFTGKIPPAETSGRHWLMVQTPDWDASGAGHTGHWLGTPPTGRFQNVKTLDFITVKVASEWFGNTPVTARQAREAWTVLDRVLTHQFGRDLPSGVTPLMFSPGGTGHHLWSWSIPQTLEIPQLEPDIAEQLHATSTQHHLDHLVAGTSLPDHPDVVPLIDPKVSPNINSFAYLDGRFMYASLTRELGVAPGHRIRREECWDIWQENRYVRARFLVKFKVPADWNHVGIFGMPFEDSNAGWYYPNRPGATGEAWVDSSELFVAEQFGWSFDFVEGIVFNHKRKSTRKRFENGSDVATRRTVNAAPLDLWSERLQTARTMIENHPDLSPTVRQAVGAALRAILIQAIGGFASRGRSRTGSTRDPKMIPPEYQSSVVRKGKDFIYQIPQQLSRQQEGNYHPELALQIWGRGRAKVLHHKVSGTPCGALTLPGNSIIGINGDAIYTTEMPRWALPVQDGGADDGKAGRIRVQGFLNQSVKTPETRAQRDRLRDRAQKAEFDSAEFAHEFLPIDDLGANYEPGEEE